MPVDIDSVKYVLHSKLTQHNVGECALFRRQSTWITVLTVLLLCLLGSSPQECKLLKDKECVFAHPHTSVG